MEAVTLRGHSEPYKRGTAGNSIGPEGQERSDTVAIPLTSESASAPAALSDGDQMLIVELRESDPALVALVREAEDMPGREDKAIIAGQLADLTQTVEGMANQLKALRDRADSQQQRADTQHERIDLAARELAEVSDRLHAAANALRESI